MEPEEFAWRDRALEGVPPRIDAALTTVGEFREALTKALQQRDELYRQHIATVAECEARQERADRLAASLERVAGQLRERASQTEDDDLRIWLKVVASRLHHVLRIDRPATEKTDGGS